MDLTKRDTGVQKVTYVINPANSKKAKFELPITYYLAMEVVQLWQSLRMTNGIMTLRQNMALR
jgi:hypothetical protein